VSHDPSEIIFIVELLWSLILKLADDI